MRAYPVESFVVEAVKDELLPTDLPGFQAGKAFLDKALEDCPSVVAWHNANDPNQESLPFSSSDPYTPTAYDEVRLLQPSIDHQRSFELTHPLLDGSWQDEFGNTYSSINLKGNNYAEPGVLETATATDRVIAYGLQESSVIERVLRASRILRSHGIGTEYIVGLAEPKEYPWPTVDKYADCIELVSLPEYKQRIVEQYWRQLPDKQRTPEALVNLSAKFEHMTFYVSARAVDTSYRLHDMANNDEAINKIMDHVNTYLLPESEKPFTRSPEDVTRYLQTIFVPRAAHNLSALHTNGLAHRYPNALNVSALGSIVDLDSVHGEPLQFGDEPITEKDMAEDLLTLLGGLSSTNIVKGVYPSKDLLPSFVKTYFEASMQRSPDRWEGIVWASKLILAINELVKNDDQDIDLSNTYRGMLQAIINKEYLQLLENEEIQGQKIDIKSWIKEELPAFQSEIQDAIEKNIPEYGPFLYDGYINELSDPTFDLIENCLANPRALHEVQEWMTHNIAELAADKFREQLDIPSTDFVNADQQVIRLAIATADSVAFSNELQAWAYNLLLESLPGWRSAFEEACSVVPFESLFTEYRSLPIFHSSANRLLMETMEVPLEKVITLLEQTTHEIMIEHIEIEKGQRDFTYEITDDGSVISEFISDGRTDGLSCDYTHTITYLNFGELPGTYMLFVEVKPDGTTRLRLQLEDKELVERMRSSNEPMTILRAAFFAQGVLF